MFAVKSNFPVVRSMSTGTGRDPTIEGDRNGISVVSSQKLLEMAERTETCSESERGYFGKWLTAITPYIHHYLQRFHSHLTRQDLQVLLPETIRTRSCTPAKNEKLLSVRDNDKPFLTSLTKRLRTQVGQITRRVVCTRPVSRFLLKHYVSSKNTEGIQVLLDKGVVIDQDNLTYKASVNQDMKTLNLLMENGAPVKRLMEAYIPGRAKALEMLINRYKVNLKKVEYHSLVTTAVKLGYIDSLKVLLENGAPVDANDYAPSWAAAEKDNLEAFKLLIEYGAPEFGCDGIRITFFNKAFVANSVNIVEYMLSLNPFSTTVSILDGFKGKEVPLHEVRKEYFMEALKTKCCNHILLLMLIELGADGIDELDDGGCEGLYKKALDLKLLNPPEDSKAITDYRNQLRNAVKEAHSRLQHDRLFSLESIAASAVKQSLNNRLGRDPGNALTIRASIDQLEYPERFKQMFKERYFSPALHPLLPVNLMGNYD